MAFPTIPTVAAGRVLTNTQANLTPVRTFPSLTGLTKNSGDLLLAICVVYQSSAAANSVFSGWTGGFTEVADRGGTTANMSIGVAWKLSNGTEIGTITVTQANTISGHAAMILLSIPGVHPSAAPTVGNIVNATGSAANINSTNAGWGAQDALWIALAGSGEMATAGSFTGITAAPTNYANFVASAISSDVVGGVQAAVAFRQLNTAIEDPDAFTVDTSNARNSSLVIAVRPAPTSVSITQATETDTPLTLGILDLNSYSITTATETDLANSIVGLQVFPALETDTTHVPGVLDTFSITQATETDSAQAVDYDKSVTITTATETDTTFAMVARTRITTVTVTATAVALSFGQTPHDITPATETDLANATLTFQPLPAETTDTSQTLTLSEGGEVLDPATEIDGAQPVSVTQAGGINFTLVTETDLANAIVSLQPLPDTEVDEAQVLSYFLDIGFSIVPALETDTAGTKTRQTGITLPEWETIPPLPYNTKVAVGDVSTALALSKTQNPQPHKDLTPATETDSATGDGPNLIANGGFEEGTLHWDTVGTMSMQVRTYAQTPWVPSLFGTSLAQVEANNTNDGIITEPDEWIVVRPSTEYTLSAWFYAETPFNPNIAWSEYTADDLLIAGSATGVLVPANTWTRIALTGTTNVLTQQLEVSIYLPTGAPQEFWIDSVNLSQVAADALVVSKLVPSSTAMSTASAQALVANKASTLVAATSTNAAQPLTYQQFTAGHYTIQPAVSTETAVTPTFTKTIYTRITLVNTTNTARRLRYLGSMNDPPAFIDHTGGTLTLTDQTPEDELTLLDHLTFEEV